MNAFERFCFRLLGRIVKKEKDEYHQLRGDLLSAHMKVPFEVYVSTAYVSAILVGGVVSLILGFITWHFHLPELIFYHGALPEFFFTILEFRRALGTIFVTDISFAVLVYVIYLIFLFYPSIMAGDRRRKIDATLPYAMNYVTAMSTAGIPPAEIFRLLGESPVYGECAAEARYLTRDIDLLGRDLTDAMRRLSGITPSMRMKEFLQGAVATIQSGSDLTIYFRLKAEQYALENQQEQKMFIETLALIAESYVTVMVAGVLFLIIIQSVMSMVSGESDPLLLNLVIYLMVPFGSIMFIILVSSMTPEV